MQRDRRWVRNNAPWLLSVVVHSPCVPFVRSCPGRHTPMDRSPCLLPHRRVDPDDRLAPHRINEVGA